MNYNDLIEQLSGQTGQSNAEIKEVLAEAISVLTDQLSKGNGVSIPNLGTFQTKMTKEKKVYNPHYEAYMKVPPKRVVEFSPASGLKEKVKFLGTEYE